MTNEYMQASQHVVPTFCDRMTCTMHTCNKVHNEKALQDAVSQEQHVDSYKQSQHSLLVPDGPH